MRNEQREFANYISDNYDELYDGECVTGNTGKGCFRLDNLGEHPSGCDLHVKREGDWLIYNCFSSGCPNGGSVRIGKSTGRTAGVSGGRTSSKRNSRKPNQLHEANRVLKRSVRHLPDQCIEYLEGNNITRRYAQTSGVMWDALEGQLVIPVFDNGETKGALIRKIGGGLRPHSSSGARKWDNRVVEDSVFFSKGNGTTLYIVEAPTSALALNEHLGVNVVACLGIKLSEGRARSIKTIMRDSGCTEAVLLPDPDVTREECRELKKLLTGVLGTCKVKRLNKKPRYCLEEILC